MPKSPARPQQPPTRVSVAPARWRRAASRSHPTTATWWQCGWATTSTPSRSGGSHPVASRCSARLRKREGSKERSSISWAASWRSRDRHDGSSTTTGRPSAPAPSSAASICVSDRAAASSWPVLKSVRPQQLRPSATRWTVAPAASSTRRAASATWGAKRSVKVSTHSTTSAPAGSGVPASRREETGRDAGSGSGRRGSTPAARARAPGAVLSAARTTRAGVRDSSCGRRPSVTWVRGRRFPAYLRCSASTLYVAMSTPVGQSRRQPLQARQRSSASSTSSASSPGSRPLTASCSTRARPRVESFSSPVARYDGHITPPLPVLSATHLPTPVQRCTASTRPRSSRSRSRTGPASVGAASRTSASSGAGTHEDAGVEEVVRVRERLDPSHQGQRLRGVHPAEQLRAGPAVSMLARQAAAVPGGQVGGLLDEGAVAAAAVVRGEVEADADVEAAVAEVAVRRPVQPVGGEQGIEVAQVGTQALRWDGGVLPPGLAGRVGGAGRQPGAVLADPPDRCLLADVVDDAVVPGARRAHHQVAARHHLGPVVPGDLDQQPPAAGRHRGHRGHQACQSLVHPLARHGVVLQHGGHGIRGLGHAGVAEDHEDAVPGLAHQPHGRLGDHGEGALAADEEAVERPAVLGEQVLEGVAGPLPGEPAELGADQGELGADQAPPSGRRARARRHRRR